jgi:HrpA-like RNA helicase
MKQRAGRAGRTSSGVCWRLCSEEFATDDLLPQTVAEMLRTPLDELILQIGLLYEQRRDEYNASVGVAKEVKGIGRRAFAPGFRPVKFLSMTPSPPAEHSLVQACKHLLEVGALAVVHCGGEQNEWLYRLTPLGVSFDSYAAFSFVLHYS